jgi:DNA polymerase (family 10)
MVNQELARIFSEIADLMEIKGEDAFRINSYRKAARLFKDTTEDIAALSAAGKLTDLPGVGKHTAQRVTQFLAEGKIDVHQALRASVPAGLPGLLAIPGLGPKRIALVWRELGVECLADLKGALEAGKVALLPGMGQKTADKIRQGIEFLERSSGRIPIGRALPLARQIVDELARFPGVRNIAVAGSLRRGKETIGDVDILCDASEGHKVIKAFTVIQQVAQLLVSGDTKGSVLVGLPQGGQMQVDLRVVSAESFGAALQYFTGSKEHNIRLRELAVKKGWKLNEYGLFDGDKQIAGRTEEEIYRQLDMPLIPPELREDRGEIEAADRLPQLVELSDIRGDLHLHTPASDGKNTIEELAAAAKKQGYRYIAISDHSKSETIAKGLSIKAMKEHIRAVRAAAQKTPGIEVLLSTEVDVLSDGTLDYPDEILAECDIVTASIHTGMSQDRAKTTARTIAAMRSPYVNIIGHPTGRLIGEREAMDLDMGAVIEAAVQTGTALEVNAAWQRLDLCDRHIRQAIEVGARLVISTDGHSVSQMVEYMPYGVITARRGWATKKNILNTCPLRDIKKFVAAKRR